VALSATFVADFSSFMTATKDAVAAMQGFKLSAQDLGPAADRGLAATAQQAEQIGRQLQRVGADAVAASQVFIAAFAEEQEAVGRLTTALETTGQATPAVIAAYGEMATQFQNTTKYADEAITSTQAVLTTIGRVGPEQMQLALTAVTNLASGMKIDLATAAQMVAKAIGSGGESLGKLKVALGDTIQPGMDTADMLQAINEKFGPAATAEMQTYNGQMAQLNNTMSDFQEMVGKVLVENLSGLLKAFQSLPEPVQKFTVAVVAIGTVIAPVLVSLAALVSMLAATGIGAALLSALGAIVALLTGPVGLVIAIAAVLAAVVYNWDAIVDYTKQLYTGIKTWLVDKFDGIVASVKERLAAMAGYFKGLYQSVIGGSSVPDLMQGIDQQFGRLDSLMVDPALAATADVSRAFRDMHGAQAATAATGRLALGGAGGGGTTITNSFTITGGGVQDIARQVMDEITRQMRTQRKLPTA
jgi:hypothetical protein